MNLSPLLVRAKTFPINRWITTTLLVATVLALAVRVAGFFWLPNIDGDAYCYLDKARELRAAILAGSLRVQDLFFFWLPLYPLAVAVVSLVVPHGGHLMFMGKLVSAVSGLASCWLVYRLLVALTQRPRLALLGALIVALDPWQLLYSSNSMTELPFEALVLGALDRTVHRRWTAASLLLVAAGFIRIEAWVLTGLIPVAVLLVERRIKIWPVVLVFVAPAAWLAISYATKGDVRAYFTIRNAYVADFLVHDPQHAHPSGQVMFTDFANLGQGGSFPLVVGAAAAFVWFVVGGLIRRRALPGAFAAAAVSAVFLLLFGFLMAAYVTHSQPVLWVRYGVIYQPLAVCLTLWWLAEGTGPRVRWVAALILGWGLIGHDAAEFHVINDTRGNLLFQRQAAAFLASLHPHRVYCDSIVVRVEADLMPDRARDSAALRSDPAGFLEDLRLQGVDYLVYIDSEASTPVKIFPELAKFQPAFGLEPFHKINSPDWRPPVLIYRVGPFPVSGPPSVASTRAE